MGAEVFLDSAYAIALASPNDRFHPKAHELAAHLVAKKIQLITTRGVLLEIGNALAKPRYRDAAVRLLASVENDPGIEIIPLSTELFATALKLFRERLDKDWGLTDCVSFVAMNERGIKDALTTDIHFQQAGFNAMMR